MERVKGRNNNKLNEKIKSSVAKKIHIVGIDYTLYISVILLVLIGIVMVFSASYYIAVTQHHVGRFHYLRAQSIAAVLGFVIMILVSNFNYRYTKSFVNLFYFISIGMLVLVIATGLTAGGAQRWLYIPVIGLTFQPSEVVKLALIMMVSNLISKKSNKNLLNSFFGTAFVSMFILIPMLLINTQNLSTVIILAIIGFGIIFIASPFTAVFVGLGVAATAGLTVFLAFFAQGFRAGRFEAWLNPFADPTDTGFQTVQSLYAIGSGGIFGMGLGQSRQKLGFIPEAHNDIIFSVIVEELGLLGGGLILFLFGVLLWRAIKIAVNAGDLFGSLIATGIAIMIGSQTIINVGVVTNAIPNTGVPMPFISYGGTSLMITMASIGLLLSISRYTKKLGD